MKLLISLSAKQVGDLYHLTGKTALLEILRTGKLQLTLASGTLAEQNLQRGKNFYASLTRSRFGGYHYKDGGTDEGQFSNAKVMITLDGTLLSSNHKLIPVDYWGDRERQSENEERLVSDKEEIPFLRYITRVDFIQPAVLGKKETYGMDRGKFKLVKNEFLEHAIGSILLQLKKRKIPYSFYNTMRDWALKRNEFSYSGAKGVSIDTRRSYSLKHTTRALTDIIEALSDKPYAEMGRGAQELCYNIRNHPRDIDGALNDVANSRKPDSDPYARKLSTKIARMTKRKGLTNNAEIGAYIANKYETHATEEARATNRKKSVGAATEIMDMLQNDVDDWQRVATLSVFDSPMDDMKAMTDRWGYKADSVERTIKRTLEFYDVPEVRELTRLMEKMNLESAMDVLSYIFRRKIAPRLAEV